MPHVPPTHPPTPQSAAATAHPTIADPWHPRKEAWLGRNPSRFGAQDIRPLFVGGCPRSGTTLLRSMLNNHPDLAMPAETDFVIPLWNTRVGYGDLRDPANRRRVGEWIFHQDGHGGRRIRTRGIRDGPRSPEQAIDLLVGAAPTLGSLLAACFELYADSHGKSRWGDKRPAYAGYVDALFALFPNAQFINVVRDPRGAVSSIMGLGWYRRKMALAAATATWSMSVERVDRVGRGLRPDQLLDVRFEDFVRDPAATLERVCAFASLEAGDAIDQMITGERRGNFREGWHDKLSEAVSTAPIDSWVPKLEPEQIAFIERVAGPQMDRFGYRPVAGVDAAPRRRDLRLYDQQIARRRDKWKRQERNELKRRLVLYRRPVGALGADPSTWPRRLRKAAGSVVVAGADGAPGAPRDAQDHAGDGQTDERVGGR